eukprot:scaffold131738_cov36-Phaeocystis_antarctica.AAC.1
MSSSTRYWTTATRSAPPLPLPHPYRLRPPAVSLPPYRTLTAPLPHPYRAALHPLPCDTPAPRYTPHRAIPSPSYNPCRCASTLTPTLALTLTLTRCASTAELQAFVFNEPAAVSNPVRLLGVRVR